MNEFWSSLSKWFSEKTSSPLYFTYLGFFVGWNWKFFQILFLENATLFSSPRIEYIAEKIPFHFGFPLPWGFFFELIANVIWEFIPPMILTYAAIVWLPHIQKWALNEYLKGRFERKRMFEEKRREYEKWSLNQEKERDKNLGELVEVKQKQARKKKDIVASLTDEERWLSEFESLKQRQNFRSALQISRDIIYQYNGHYVTQARSVGAQDKYVSADVVSLLDVWGLITLKQVSTARGQMTLTEKGRFFLAKFVEGNIS